MSIHNIIIGYTMASTSILIFIFGLFSWTKNKTSPVNRVFFHMSLLASAWSFCIYLQIHLFTNNYSLAIISAKFCHSFALFTSVSWMHFVFKLLNLPNREKKDRIIFLFSYILSLIISIVTIFTDKVVLKLHTITNIEGFTYGGPLYFIHTFLMGVFITSGIYQLYKHYKISTGIKRSQIGYVLLSGSLCFPLGMTTAFGVYNIPIYPFGIYLTWAYIPIIAYAIVKYRLMDILVVINKTVLFVITISLGLIFHALFTRMFEPIFGPWASFFISLIGIILILFFTPLRPKLIKLVDHYVYRGKYDYHEIIKEASGKVVSILELDHLLTYLLGTIQNAVGVNKVCLLLREEIKLGRMHEDKLPSYRIRASRGLDRAAIQDFKTHNGIIDYIKQEKKSLVKEELERTLPQKDMQRLYKHLEAISQALVIPLFYSEELIGLLTLDNKETKEPYSTTDIQLLQYLANQAATALENARLYREAVTDGLTSLYHHRYFKLRLEDEIHRFQRYKHPISLIMIDIDFFKHFNDTYGHLKGDMALKALASLLKKEASPSDIVCRYGGEEFVIILPHTDLENAKKLAYRLREKVEASTLGPGKLTISLGVTTYEKDLNKDKFIKNADTALYEAKRRGRNRVEVL